MHRLYGFIRAHSGAVLVVLAAALAAEAGFICWQRSVQAEIVNRLIEGDDLPPEILITATPVEDSPFVRRDRLHVIVASSVYSSDSSVVPLTLDFDVVAHFGPFGLNGDIYPLNSTASTAELLVKLAGTHPRLAIRYHYAVFAQELRITATATPFDMQLDAVERGVGPVSWSLAARKPVALRLALTKKEGLKAEIEAPEISGSLTDPAANILKGSAEDVKAAARLELAGKKPGDWYVKSARVTAAKGGFEAGDWRGALTGRFTKIVSKIEESPADLQEGRLSGAYDARAATFDIGVDSSQPGLAKHVAGKDFILRFTADRVPAELFKSLDEYRIGRLLTESGPMHLRIEEFAMRSVGREGEAKFTADLKAGQSAKTAMERSASRGAAALRSHSGEEKPDLDWNFSIDAPESLIDLAEIILHGARPDMRDLSLKSLMVPKDENGIRHYLSERSSASAP